MDTADLVRARKEAEKAVSDMPEGPLKLKAFELILDHLLSNLQQSSGPDSGVSRKPATATKAPRRAAHNGGLTSRIRALAEEGYFDKQRSLTDVQERLRELGHNHSLQQLSSVLVRLVKAQELQRSRVRHEGRKKYLYSKW